MMVYCIGVKSFLFLFFPSAQTFAIILLSSHVISLPPTVSHPTPQAMKIHNTLILSHQKKPSSPPKSSSKKANNPSAIGKKKAKESKRRQSTPINPPIHQSTTQTEPTQPNITGKWRGYQTSITV
jgi:hypothetical protein